MSLVLDLKPEVENALRDCAAEEGVSIADLLARTFLPRAARHAKSETPRARVQALLTKWQEADPTPVAAPAPNDGTITPYKALFRKWAQEDAAFEDNKGADLRLS